MGIRWHTFNEVFFNNGGAEKSSQNNSILNKIVDSCLSRKLASASWSPSCFTKVLGGLESPIAWNYHPPPGWLVHKQFGRGSIPPRSPPAANSAASASSASLCFHIFHAKLKPSPAAKLAFVPYPWASSLLGSWFFWGLCLGCEVQLCNALILEACDPEFPDHLISAPQKTCQFAMGNMIFEKKKTVDGKRFSSFLIISRPNNPNCWLYKSPWFSNKYPSIPFVQVYVHSPHMPETMGSQVVRRQDTGEGRSSADTTCRELQESFAGCWFAKPLNSKMFSKYSWGFTNTESQRYMFYCAWPSCKCPAPQHRLRLPRTLSLQYSCCWINLTDSFTSPACSSHFIHGLCFNE